MSIADRIRQSGPIRAIRDAPAPVRAALLSALILAACVGWFSVSRRVASAVDKPLPMRYINIASTGELAPRAFVAPHNADPTLTWAAVFTCGECMPEQQFIGYIEKYNPLTADADAGTGFDIAAHDQRPFDWHPAEADPSILLQESLFERCTGGLLKRCNPQ